LQEEQAPVVLGHLVVLHPDAALLTQFALSCSFFLSCSSQRIEQSLIGMEVLLVARINT
jgi:hypothetical protein